MDTRIIHLLARKLSGEATAEERAELDLLLTRNPEAVYYAELITQLWDEEKMRTFTDTDIAWLRHISRHRPAFNQGPAPAGAGGKTEIPEQAGPVSHDHLAIDASPEPLVPRSRKRMAWMACGAALLAAAGLLLFEKGQWHDRQMPAPTPHYIESYAGPGARKSVILPDGTRVRLNAGSMLRYDADMLQRDSRDVQLSGEAYFDVEKDVQHSFVIHTDKIAIKVLGTAFNVRAYPKDKVTETTLMRGSIELTVNNKPYQKIVLKPREKFALIDDMPEAAVPAAPKDSSGLLRHGVLPPPVNKEKLVVQDVVPVEVEDKQYVKEVSWVEDNFVFQNETLEELAPRMERWFNVTISIDNQRIRGLHFTGIFHKETLTQALQAMQFIKPFKFKITDNHVFIN